MKKKTTCRAIQWVCASLVTVGILTAKATLTQMTDEGGGGGSTLRSKSLRYIPYLTEKANRFISYISYVKWFPCDIPTIKKYLFGWSVRDVLKGPSKYLNEGPLLYTPTLTKVPSFSQSLLTQRIIESTRRAL